MTTHLLFALTTFTGFFAMMNPLANTPIFIGLTEDDDDRTKKVIAFKSLTLALIIISAFTIGGRYIFELFSISLPAFQITGGILIFMIGYHMLHGQRSPIQKSRLGTQPGQTPANSVGSPPSGEAGGGELDEAKLGIAISPLATPILAGPGTIATAMSFVSEGSLEHVLITIGTFAILCLITYLLFINGQRLVRYVGDEVLRVITRMMGLLLAVMGTQMVLRGIHAAKEMTF